MRRSSLVLSALGQEHETLAGLASPGSDGVRDSRLLILVEDRELLGLDGLVMEVDEALGEAQTPVDTAQLDTVLRTEVLLLGPFVRLT